MILESGGNSKINLILRGHPSSPFCCSEGLTMESCIHYIFCCSRTCLRSVQLRRCSSQNAKKKHALCACCFSQMPPHTSSWARLTPRDPLATDLLSYCIYPCDQGSW
ncbi:hypothetical protein LIA77_03829 [Sarocladium implicatum]|nr:hypothetical protein LIA77_03829 [Sarocladium implicatum]